MCCVVALALELKSLTSGLQILISAKNGTSVFYVPFFTSLKSAS